jgi:uncharacterized membrane protein
MIRVSEQVGVPPATLWASLIDVENLPVVTESITAVRIEDGGPLGPGSRVRISQPGIPSATWVVTDWKEGREFSWVAAGPGVRSRARHRVLGVAGSSQLELELEHTGPLGWLSRLLFDRRTRRYLVLEAAGLKKHAESHA